MRRGLRKLPAAFLLALASAGAAAAVDVLFSWPADPDPALTGYAVYRRTGGADWETLEELPLSALDDPAHPALLVTGLSPGTTYWFAAASLYADGSEGPLVATTCVQVGESVLDCHDEDEDGTRVTVSCFLTTAGR